MTDEGFATRVRDRLSDVASRTRHRLTSGATLVADGRGLEVGSPGRDGSQSAEPEFPLLSEESRDLQDVLLERGLSPEEYICEALEEDDGRLRQQRICDLTGWSAASVSRTLGKMESEGTITRFRVGNEKVVCLPHADPRVDDVDSTVTVSN